MTEQDKIPEASPVHDSLNGAYVIFERPDGSVFCTKSLRTNIPPWEFTGGEINFGEVATVAASREGFEEGGIRSYPGDLVWFALLKQRVPKLGPTAEGFVFLYVCSVFDDSQLITKSDETTDARFIPFDELVEMLRTDKFFSLGYRKMLARYVVARLLKKQIGQFSPEEALLRTPVQVPANPPFDV